MALPTNTFATYEAIGNREDLSDVIYRIDPTDTPLMTGIEREKASAVNHEWQTQALAAADTANAVLEGDDATTDAVTPTVRLGNICQISDKVARVTGTQRAVDHAGRDDELAYQEMLKGLELKRDMEAILVGTNQAKVTGNDTTARKTASVLSWIKTNTSIALSDPPKSWNLFVTVFGSSRLDRVRIGSATPAQGKLVAEGTPDELKRRIGGGHIRLQFADASGLEG